MATRRALLGAAAGAAAGSIAGSVAIGAPALGASRASTGSTAGLPLTVVNNTDKFPNRAIWLYVVGTELDTGRHGYVRKNGTFTRPTPSDNGPGGYADIAIPLASSGATTLTLPYMSGRIYFSINERLRFRVLADKARGSVLEHPAGWIANNPNYAVMHDCVEFTYNSTGMYCNTTMVDMFSIPLDIRLDGARRQTTGTLANGGRSKIFRAMSAQRDFANLVIGNGLRIIAPGHGISAGRFPARYFDTYVNDVWTRYARTDLRVTTNNVTRVGRVSGDRLVFNRGVAPFAKPTTRDVLFCSGALAAPNDGVTGPIAAVLGAGFNRSTLQLQADQPGSSSSAHYRNPVTNHYSRILHENVVDGRAYGFPFDDVGDRASYVQDSAPTGVRVTLTPF